MLLPGQVDAIEPPLGHGQAVVWEVTGLGRATDGRWIAPVVGIQGIRCLCGRDIVAHRCPRIAAGYQHASPGIERATGPGLGGVACGRAP